MKTLITLLCLTCLPLMAQDNILCPLHEEDPHFIEYRALMIENYANIMMDGYWNLYMDQKISPNEFFHMYNAYNVIIFNLGLPSEID